MIHSFLLLFAVEYEHSMNGFIPIDSESTLSDVENRTCGEESSVFFTDFPRLISREEEIVNCGTISCSKQIYAAGKRDYHASLGCFKNIFINYSDLQPISVMEARYVASVHIHTLRTSEIRKWLDGKAVVLHCDSHFPKMKTMLLFPELSEKKNTLRIAQITERDSLANVVGIHHDQEITYLAEYDILSNLHLDTYSQEASAEATSLWVNFYWEGTVSTHTEVKPPQSAKAVLGVRVTAGEPRSALNDIFLELTSLDKVANFVPSSPASENSTMSSAGDLEKMYNDLEQFKETVGEFSSYGDIDHKQQSDDNDDDLEKPMSELIKQSFKRNDYDFTDKLWLLLHDVGEFKDMRNYLDDILTDIVHGTLQPAVSPLNTTKLAKLIRKLYIEEQEDSRITIREKIMDLLSSNRSVANLIFSIGFEKMKKDYFNYFLSKELTLTSNLEALHNPQNSSIGSYQSGGDITLLWKLHYCLEIVTTPTIYLQINRDCQRSLLAAALEYYSGNNGVGAYSPVFRFSLLPVHDSSSPLFDSCKSLQPKFWKQATLVPSKSGFKRCLINCATEQSFEIPEDTVELDVGVRKQKHAALEEEIVPLI